MTQEYWKLLQEDVQLLIRLTQLHLISISHFVRVLFIKLEAASRGLPEYRARLLFSTGSYAHHIIEVLRDQLVRRYPLGLELISAEEALTAVNAGRTNLHYRGFELYELKQAEAGLVSQQRMARRLVEDECPFDSEKCLDHDRLQTTGEIVFHFPISILNPGAGDHWCSTEQLTLYRATGRLQHPITRAIGYVFRALEPRDYDAEEMFQLINLNSIREGKLTLTGRVPPDTSDVQLLQIARLNPVLLTVRDGLDYLRLLDFSELVRHVSDFNFLLGAIHNIERFRQIPQHFL